MKTQIKELVENFTDENISKFIIDIEVLGHEKSHQIFKELWKVLGDEDKRNSLKIFDLESKLSRFCKNQTWGDFYAKNYEPIFKEAEKSEYYQSLKKDYERISRQKL